MVRTLYFSCLPSLPSFRKQWIVVPLVEPETLGPLSQPRLPFRRSSFSCPWSIRGYPWERLKKMYARKGMFLFMTRKGVSHFSCACVGKWYLKETRACRTMIHVAERCRYGRLSM